MLPQHLPDFTVDAEGAFDAASAFTAQVHIDHALRDVCKAELMDFQKAKQQVEVGCDIKICSVQSVPVEKFFIAIESRMRRHDAYLKSIGMKDGRRHISDDFIRIFRSNEADITKNTI